VTQPAQSTPPPSREWFWRVLAALMLVMACWVGWVAYQIAPVSVATPAAYHALTQARAAQNVQGLIRPAGAAELARPAAPQPARKAPVDLERLRLADSIETPIQPK
jgi:hypothetical protein